MLNCNSLKANKVSLKKQREDSGRGKMSITRRTFCHGAFHVAAGVGAASALRVPLSFPLSPPANASTYLNPVLAGDHPDAGAIRVGEDFFLTHSSFDYAPGLYIWH